MQLGDLGHACVRELAALLDLLVFDVDDHALDDVADLLHVDGEADDVRPALAFLFAQRLARDLGEVILDGRVQLIDLVIHLADAVCQHLVVLLNHVERAGEHGLHHVGLIERLARRARDGQRRRGKCRRVQVLWPLVLVFDRLGQQPRHQVSHPLREADEAHADDDVVGQMEQHHALRCIAQQRLHVFHPQADERRHDAHAQNLEHHVAHGDLAHLDGGFGRGHHRQQAAAQIGAQHQAERDVELHHIGCGHGRDQQHDG
ncbi:hypothetical protein SDC9_91293 [bioreactor metagenome]|uniref:NAD-specific glutamate dehydrogenase n=1 Tax=bioreactor metagenome TaxID=1076179 RepID=A0A645A4A3_9ZZZZ